jgi:hypothetical protein
VAVKRNGMKRQANGADSSIATSSPENTHNGQSNLSKRRATLWHDRPLR